MFRKRKFEQDLDDELRSFVELQAAEKMRGGMPPEDALRQAWRELGGMEQVKESVRDVRPGVFMSVLLQDIRYALRTLRRNPSFACIAILTLAMGIGANTAIFSVVDAVLLKPLPYPGPSRLLTLWERSRSDGLLGTVAPSNFYDWREQSSSFSRMAAIDPYPDFILNRSGPGSTAQRLSGADVTADFFPLLGVRMAMGRDFLSEEDRPERNQVVVLSYAAWKAYFGGRADILGHAVPLNGTAYTVVGVLPRDFSFVSKASDYHARNRFDLFRPMALPTPPPAWMRGTHPLCVIARMKPRVTLERAQADLNRIAANLEHLYPGDDKGMGVAAVPLEQHVVADVRGALLALVAAIGLLLLLTSANVANLLLTRAVARSREISLRFALGASRPRIARQLMTESLVLTASGGLLGLILAFAAVPAVVRHLPADLPRTAEIAVNCRVLIFTAIVTLFAGLLFGLAPVVYAGGPLRQAGRGIIGGRSRLRSALVVGQVAIALVLLGGAGVMAKSLWKLLEVPPGFRTQGLLTARLSLPPEYTNGGRFGTGAHREISKFQQRVLDRVRALPGVASAAFTAYLPLSGADNDWVFRIEGRPPKPPGEFDVAHYRPVGPGYFETMGIPCERGRCFTAADNEDGLLVVAINQAMARKFWGNADPLGQRLRFGDVKWRKIVGIVADVHHDGLDVPAAPEMYVPYSQVPNVEARPTIVLRATADAWSLAAPLRGAVASIDRTVPVDQITTIRELISNSAGQPRFRTTVILAFSALALFVASLGLYGVMNYLVSQRMQEFGIRMALGATRGAVMQLVFGEAAKMVATGIAIGLAGAAVLSRAIATLLYGATSIDALTLASVAMLLALVALAGVWFPARRAGKSDPMESLRHD